MKFRRGAAPFPRALAIASIFGLCAAAGCTLIYEAPVRQCEVDADCDVLGLQGACRSGLCTAEQGGGSSSSTSAGGGGLGGAGPWDCVGDVEWPAENMGIPVDFTLGAIKLIGQTPFEGLTVRACLPFDAGCDPPLSEGVTGSDGRFTLEVYEGFRGHFYAPPPPNWPEMVPFYLHLFPPPSAGEANVQGSLNLASFADLEAILSVLGKERVPGLGHIFITAVDCTTQRAADVTLATDVVDPETFVAYVNESGLPSTTLAATSTRGEAAIANVPPGYITVRGVSTDVGKYFEQTVLVVADSITGLPVVPSP